MNLADRFIQSYDPLMPHSPCEWLMATRHVINRLEEFLGADVQFETPLEDYVRDGVRMDIVCIPRTFKNLQLIIKGILASIVQTNGLTFGVTLFLYCNQKRLITNTGEAFVDLEYRSVDGEGEWLCRGWFKDEYGEYEDFGGKSLP